MKFFTKLCLVLCAAFVTHQGLAQISFIDQNDLLNGANYSSVAIAVADVNNDQLDDIVRLNNGNVLNIQYQTPNGDPFTEFYFGEVAGGNQWMITVADCNNNGFGDIMSGDYTHSRFITANETGTNYSAAEFPGGDFFAQGANFADINNDGLLDAFICNDDGESFIYENNGAGGFNVANDWIDMSINGSSGEEASGNYGSVWTDFDNDGDLDLYIAHCRQGVSSPSDERRINKLFVNDGNNNYTEMAEEYGLRIGWQSWTSDFQDIDNDGDLDCFITNHDYESQILENDGTGHFTDITASTGINVMGTAVQGIMRDFDNDGWVDIIVAGSIDYLYRNNGDKTFTEVTNAFGPNDMESFAVGDLNQDGFMDVYAGYANLFNSPSNIQDVLWMNDAASGNNYIAINLEGTVSNAGGVGARIEIYGEWGMQIREIRAGESYGISNSLIGYFGIGDATEIDHVIVKWPSGIVTVTDNPSINTTITIPEEDCTSADIQISYTGDPIFCEGQTFTMMAPAGLNYYWSNGMNTQTITVSNPGNYSVVVENASGCFDQSETVLVQVNPDQTPSIVAQSDVSFCEGGSVILTASDASSYTWSNGMTSQAIEVNASGNYTVTTQGLCEEFTSEAIEVLTYDYADPAVASDVEIPGPGPATLTASGNNLSWFDAETGGTLQGTGPTLDLANVDVNTTFWVENSDASIVNHGPVQHVGNSEYSGDIYNGDIIFDAFTTFKLKSVKVITDTEGVRIIELRNNTGEVIATKSQMILTGESRVDLDFVIEAGTDYILTTNEAQNNTELGMNSPRLQRSSSAVSYPYMLDNVVSLTGSNLGQNRYYYFYDWEIQNPAVDCPSVRVPVTVSITTATVDINDTDAVRVFPNPTSGLFQIELDMQATDVNVIVTSISGQQLIQDNLGSISGMTSKTMDVSKLAKGSYLLQIQTESNVYFTKLIVN